jgi:2-amino-4-hydroxy-6-hydroxymethyldihydropteridine diphosphokinase
MKNSVDVFLLLGSNEGERKENLSIARRLTENSIGKIKSDSSIYETEPWGKKDQPKFLNQVILTATCLSPEEVLYNIYSIEKEMGRERLEKWGPRIIDIDIIYYGSEIIVSEKLKIPHPELQNRRFALIPLHEIARDFIHPVFNISSEELLKRCPDKLECLKIWH